MTNAADSEYKSHRRSVYKVDVNGRTVNLTNIEHRIFSCLKKNSGRVVPLNVLYESVWGEKFMPSSNNTVMVHIKNMRKKLERDTGNSDFILTVWGKGYMIK